MESKVAEPLVDRLFAARLGALSFFWIELNGFGPSSQDKTIFKLAISLRRRCPPKGRSVRHSCQPDLMFTKKTSAFRAAS